MPQSTDPDVRRYDGEEAATCTECHAFMLPLRDYDGDSGHAVESHAEDDAPWHFLFCRWGVIVPSFLSNFIADTLRLKGRQKNLAQQKAQVLAGFPNSLVCPRCLHILKRP